MSIKKEAASKENATGPEEKQAKDVVETQDKGPGPKPEASEKRKGRPLLWIFIILIGAAAAAWFAEPEKTRAFITGLIPQQTTQEAPPAEQSASPADEETMPEEEPAGPDEAQAELLPEEGPTSPSRREETALLMEVMRSLEGEIRQMRNEQQELRQAQQNLQQAQLRSRLVWIADPANRLVQIRQAWKEITTLPTLTAQERQLAEDMFALASKRESELIRWRQQLDHQADSLQVKPAENIVPESDNRWLNWLRNQFSIKPSISAAEKENRDLSLQLQHASQQLALENFPEAGAWRLLRARLQLRLSGDDATLNLPDSFAPVRQDIQQLRQQAREWLEAL